MPSVRRRPLWLLPALLFASSFGIVCSSTPTTPTVAPQQPPPPILIARATDAPDKPLVFPPATTRMGRLPVHTYEANEDASKLRVTTPSIDKERAFSFHGPSFRIVFNQPIAKSTGPSPKKPVPAAPGVLKITPTVDGEAHWLNDRTLEFAAKRPFDTEVKYSLELGDLETPGGVKL
ncbi:MAG TPA: hypothetical protein PK156_41185, partial [Polyangium sp.]|nr:hypothetical protein [Polyangium sp.]